MAGPQRARPQQQQLVPGKKGLVPRTTRDSERIAARPPAKPRGPEVAPTTTAAKTHPGPPTKVQSTLPLPTKHYIPFTEERRKRAEEDEKKYNKWMENKRRKGK